MKNKLAMIRQYLLQAREQAAELVALCKADGDETKIDHALEIDMGLEWPANRAIVFNAYLSSLEPH